MASARAPPGVSAPSGSGGPPPPSAFAFALEDPFDPGFQDSTAPDPEVLPPPAVPESVSAEIRRMYTYLVDLFPQAAGSPAVPPPRAHFEEFFSPSATPHQPVFLSWFERVRTALSDADSGSGLLPPRSSQYAVGGDHALGSAVPVNPSLLSMFERPIRPSLQVGLTVREAASLEASCQSLSLALSHTMWLLLGLLGFVRLQGFALADVTLFNTLVTSLSKCLAHQASLSASQMAFIGLKHLQFYLSHLLAYFSDINKRAMLASPLVCSDLLFAEADVARLLAVTQTSSWLKSQQAMVDMASRSAGARWRHFSPVRSPSHSSPSRHDSGSPSCQNKRVRCDSPTPSWALKGSKSGFRRWGHVPRPTR